jgi:hypothetical protein
VKSSPWLTSASQPFTPVGQFGTIETGSATDVAFGRRFSNLLGYGLRFTSASRFRLPGSQSCIYGHDAVFATARSDAAYVALAQLNKPYGLNELMYVTKFVRPPHGFVQFAIGRGVDYITLAGVTSGGLLAMANVNP